MDFSLIEQLSVINLQMNVSSNECCTNVHWSDQSIYSETDISLEMNVYPNERISTNVH